MVLSSACFLITLVQPRPTKKENKTDTMVRIVAIKIVVVSDDVYSGVVKILT